MDGSFFDAIFIYPEVFNFGRIPTAEGKSQRALCAEDSCFVWDFAVDAGAAFIVVSQAGVKFHKGGAVLFDVGFDFGVGEDFDAIFGEELESSEFRDIVEQAEMEGQVINAPVEERAAAGEGFFQRPGATRVIFDEGPSHQVIMVDVIDLAYVAIIYHFFDEMEFGLKAGVPGGTFENDEVFVLAGFFNEPIHL